MINTNIAIANELEQTQELIGNAMNRIFTMQRMRKDFPNSDEVRFELQDSLSSLAYLKNKEGILQTLLQY